MKALNVNGSSMSKSLVLTHVKWNDASIQYDGPLTVDEFEPDCILDTVGILAFEDESVISLAGDYCEADGGYRDVVHIPKVLILKRKDYKLK